MTYRNWRGYCHSPNACAAKKNYLIGTILRFKVKRVRHRIASRTRNHPGTHDIICSLLFFPNVSNLACPARRTARTHRIGNFGILLISLMLSRIDTGFANSCDDAIGALTAPINGVVRCAQYENTVRVPNFHSIASDIFCTNSIIMMMSC